MLGALAFKLGALGLRPMVAKGASFAYAGQTFSVDESGNWVNQQEECTIVSPSSHTAKLDALRRTALHLWTHCYSPKPGDVSSISAPGWAKRPFACLQRTIQRSGVDNVTAIHCAVGEEDGEARISDGPVHLAIRYSRAAPSEFRSDRWIPWSANGTWIASISCALTSRALRIRDPRHEREHRQGP